MQLSCSLRHFCFSNIYLYSLNFFVVEQCSYRIIEINITGLMLPSDKLPIFFSETDFHIFVRGRGGGEAKEKV